MTRVGFTGTQLGMTTAQLHTFKSFMLKTMPEEFHHGCCIGADTQAHIEAYSIVPVIVLHPPINQSKMTDLTGFAAEVRRPKEYLDRNRDIVDETDILIAAPRMDEEELRSGTWATVRYAVKTGKPVKILRRMGGYLNATR